MDAGWRTQQITLRGVTLARIAADGTLDRADTRTVDADLVHIRDPFYAVNLPSDCTGVHVHDHRFRR